MSPAPNGTPDSRPRVAVVVSHPIQHFCPLYRAIEASGEVRLRVIFASRAGLDGYFDRDFNREVRWQTDLVEGFAHEFLPGAELVQEFHGPLWNQALPARLSVFDPDIVVAYGFHHGISRQAMGWAQERGRPVLHVADSELRSRRQVWTRVRKALTVPRLVSRIDGFLTVGDCNEAYYLSYGASRDRLFRSPFPIDQVTFDAAIDRRDELRGQVRARLGIAPEKIVALVAGKLTRRKCPEHSIEAFAKLGAKMLHGGPVLHLVFAGDGPEAGRLADLARVRCPGAVTLAGFVPVRDLPAYYVASDLLVHPSSQDPHPLVTSEAVYCGLPVIVSDRVGSVGPTDDVRLGENGLEYPFADIDRLADLLQTLRVDEALRLRMARRSWEIGQQRGMIVSVSGFLRAVRETLAKKGRLPGAARNQRARGELSAFSTMEEKNVASGPGGAKAGEPEYEYQTYWTGMHAARPGRLTAVGYPGLGEGFNRVAYGLRLKAAQRVLRRGLKVPPATVLEAAVGVGAYAGVWRRLAVRHWTGVDISGQAIAELRARIPGGRFIQADICGPQFLEVCGQERFDLVTAIDVLYHIQDDDQFRAGLAHLAAKVTEAGSLLLSDVFCDLDRKIGPVVKRRALTTYRGLLEGLGFQLVAREPIFAVLGDPVMRPNRPWSDRALLTAWRGISKVITMTPGPARDVVGAVVAATAMPADAVLRKLGLAKGVNLEFALFSRQQSVRE